MYKNRKYRGSTASKLNSKIEKTISKNILTSITENQQIPTTSTTKPPPPKLAKVTQNQIEVHNIYQNEDDDILCSQTSVPSSQPPTQMRYFSQRSALLARTQSTTTKSLSRAPNSYFEMVLMKSGADLDKPENYILSCDHITFVNNFRSLIKKHPDFPQNIQTFIEGLSEAINDQNSEMKILSGCTINIPMIDNSYQSQDSMMMNFLMVNFLQKELIDVLLKRIEFCATNNHSNNLDMPILSLLLSQLKFVAPIFGDLLYDKILTIYANATISGKEIIIANAEFVFDPNKHDSFVQYLIDNIESVDDLLSSNNVRTFSNLYLSSKLQTKLRKKILLYINEGCAISRLPFLIKFLLKVIDDNDEILAELVMDLRSSLTWHELSITQSKEEIRKIQIEIFTYIKQGLIRSKKLFDIWQKSIQNLTFDSTKPIDLIILLMLISIREDKSHYIENIIRRQVKLEHLKVCTVDDTKTKYLHIIDLYGDVFLQILHNFLKDKNTIICEFAKKSYNIVFEIGESYQKKLLNKLVELTCNKSSSDITTIALEILKNLNIKFTKDIQNYGMLLLPMLEQISEMNLKQSRMVMELLCSIAYPLPPLQDCPTLQDHIDMLVKKQICNRTISIKKQGIIGTVQLIDHIVRTEDQQNNSNYDLNESYATVNDLPEGRGKQAASYITRILSATNHCTETLALFYDELAEVLSSKNPRNNIAGIERHFLTWLSDLMTLYFQENFIIDSDLPNANVEGLELSYQNCINTTDDTVDADYIPVAINLSLPILKSSAEACESITVLASLFNLTCTLHYIRYNSNLDSINALLGCPLLLPSFTSTIDEHDIFSNHDEILSKKIIDIHFYTANWFRMIIGCYATQTEINMRKKILIRLSNLIQLETVIRNVLKKSPSNYFPPICEFTDIEKPMLFKRPPGRTKKSKYIKNKTNLPNQNSTSEPEGHAEGMSFLATMQTQPRIAGTNHQSNLKNNYSKSHFEGLYGPREIYRQMDTNIILILSEEFDIDYPLPKEKADLFLGLLEFRFIMNDLVIKIESINGIKKFSSDQKNQYISNSLKFIRITEKFLPKIFLNFLKLQRALLIQVEKVKGALGNAELFTDRLNLMKICFGLCLRFLAAYFSYSGFDEESNKNYLKCSLQSITNDDSDDICTLTKQIIEKLFSFEKSITDIKSAVHLYHCILSLTKISKISKYEKKIRDLCKTFLCRKWHSFDGGMEKGTNCNILLDELIKGFIKNSNLKRLLEILTIISDECKLLIKRDNILKTFPNIHKGNLPMLFKGLCEELILCINRNFNGGRKSQIETIQIWEQSCENLNKLLHIVQTVPGVPRNYTLFIKYSNLFIKIFLQRGLPIFESSLCKSPDRLNQILTNLQLSTRFLHNLCCHSKEIKNSAIVSQIPFIRETVENLVFKVKAALASNNCSSAFWMGALKNKDLSGKEIISQTTDDSNENDQNSDEEIPNDDNSSADETILDINNDEV